jgi:hemerythrin-like metal-binding protein
MSFFEWTPQLDVHIPAMNEEHRWLISFMNRLHDEVKTGADRASQGKTLEELGKATVKHFADEELVMARMGFPKLDHHRKLHQQLLTKFGVHAEAFKAGGPLGDEFFHFLKFWLSAHIQCMDMQYSDFAGLNKLTARSA